MEEKGSYIYIANELECIQAADITGKQRLVFVLTSNHIPFVHSLSKTRRKKSREDMMVYMDCSTGHRTQIQDNKNNLTRIYFSLFKFLEKQCKYLIVNQVTNPVTVVPAQYLVQIIHNGFDCTFPSFTSTRLDRIFMHRKIKNLPRKLEGVTL
ncbi:hypothetical protein M9H77_22074 [Catharanthus roseus]|uniref:Uncharacterized protein n=1 Tax=Catharanthus roseus TaxID=4058 RepID=A0ACC0AQ55_CATRO|nr:hypothetical protein M9H77_22074 [Catharanthus roseus]